MRKLADSYCACLRVASLCFGQKLCKTGSLWARPVPAAEECTRIVVTRQRIFDIVSNLANVSAQECIYLEALDRNFYESRQRGDIIHSAARANYRRLSDDYLCRRQSHWYYPSSGHSQQHSQDSRRTRSSGIGGTRRGRFLI